MVPKTKGMKTLYKKAFLALPVIVALGAVLVLQGCKKEFAPGQVPENTTVANDVNQAAFEEYVLRAYFSLPAEIFSESRIHEIYSQFTSGMSPEQINIMKEDMEATMTDNS